MGTIGLVRVPAATARAGSEKTPVWVATSAPEGQWATQVAVSPDGERTYVAGPHDLFTYDAHTGALLWSTTFDGDAVGVAVGPEGRRVYLTVEASSSGDFGDFDTIAYDAVTGKLNWRAVYDAGTRDFPCCLTVSPDGLRVYVTGMSRSDGNEGDFATIAYNARSGGTIWASLYAGEGPSENVPEAIRTSPDGHLVYVTGESTGNLRNDFATVAYQTTTGQQVWASRYNSGGTRGDTPFALAVDPTGQRVFVTGCTGVIDICADAQILTIAYGAGTGDQQWVSTDDARGWGNEGDDVSVSRDGSTVYVVGDLEGSPDFDIGAFAYDAATGEEIWSSVYRHPGDDHVTDAALDPDGTQLIATGPTTLVGYESDIQTMSIDTATGQLCWSTTWNGPDGEFDDGYAIALNPAGTLAYVAGRTLDGNYEFVTLAYHL